ncbi:hypothetical protein GCM10017566_45530 [Amycolatopsis bartoniae]|uniref:Uncharacterized protein n=1 Tax=Amycolatopsis bartoniae TaxID=941986 RepID=A0A8H9MF00_9PSEU|nr:hypothetical protein GCM10017566_45530 [Amycolatopsis bartoniae]
MTRRPGCGYRLTAARHGAVGRRRAAEPVARPESHRRGHLPRLPPRDLTRLPKFAHRPASGPSQAKPRRCLGWAIVVRQRSRLQPVADARWQVVGTSIILISSKVNRWALLGLVAAQFALPAQTARDVLTAI